MLQLWQNSINVESFDPYRKWLGIPEQDQPPHHYRLLGIELFESDLDVIVNAADGRMAQVKNFQTGKQSEQSQRILNELAAAKVCLLNPQKKTEYDRRLQARLKSAAAKAEVALGDKNADSPETALSFGHYSPVSSFTSRKSKRSAKHAWVIPAAVVAAVVLLGGLLAVMFTSNSSQSVAKNTAVKAVTDNAPSQTSPTKKSYDSDITAATQPPKPAAGAETESLPAKSPEPLSKRSDSPEQPEAKELAAPMPNTSDALPPQAEIPGKPVPPPQEPAPTPAVEKSPTVEAKPKKAAVPSDDQQAEVEAKIRQIFEKEFSDAKSVNGKITLAAKLFKQGTATSDDPVARFVLWRLASRSAARAGELANALEVVDKMQEQYDVDGLELKANLLADAVDTLRTGSSGAQKTVILGESLMNAAIAADNFDLANRLLKLANTAAYKANDVQMKREMQTRTRELNRLKQVFSLIQKAQKALDDNPDNEEANLTIGRWYCLAKGNWEKGLPMLAKGSDPDLAAIAKQDLAAPAAPTAQMELGDAWWSLAEKHLATSKSVVRLRATSWYERCLPGLSGLDKTKVQKRLETSTVEIKSPLTGTHGVVVAGNVALATNGTTVQGAARGETLIDGDVKVRQGLGYAYQAGGLPCEWTIAFNRPYRLKQIRFLLWNGDGRFFNYSTKISADGQHYAMLIDRSKGEWRGWQVIDFAPCSVKAVQLIGLHGSAAEEFLVVEFEAYCIPPANNPVQK